MPQDIYIQFMEKAAASLEVIANDISYMKRDLLEIKTTLKSDYITRAEVDAKFKELETRLSPMQKAYWGILSTVGLAILVAIIRLVIIK